MQAKSCKLPEWKFVGGETQKRTFTLHELNRDRTYDIPGAYVELAVVDFVNPKSDAKLRKSIEVKSDSNGRYCEAVVNLDPADTVNLSGKYIYQITIKDLLGNVVALRGIMHISENINKTFI